MKNQNINKNSVKVIKLVFIALKYKRNTTKYSDIILGKMQ